MLCEKVLPLLSEFFDEALEADVAVQVSQHLDECASCRKELESLSALHLRLRSLREVRAPAILGDLVKIRLAGEPWRVRARNELDRYWSIMRTTERMWYGTRALGTVMASVFFLLIYIAVTPYYIGVEAQSPLLLYPFTPADSHQVSINFSKKLGVFKISGRSGPAAIHDLYLLEFGDRISHGGTDDSFSVDTVVDSSGAAKVQSVIEYPSDKTLLHSFNDMISSAHFRPASSNGQAITSHLVFSFSKIFVSD
jgi:hypothetical protein